MTHNDYCCATDALKAIVDKAIKKRLKQTGFKKRGYLWNRSRGGLVDVVFLQRSSYSDQDFQSFTVNFGVCVEELYNIIWEKGGARFVTYPDCQVSLRVGRSIDAFEAGGGREVWWTLKSGDLRFEETHDSVDVEFGKLFPSYFEEFGSVRGVRDYLRRYVRAGYLGPWDGLYLALMDHMLGEDVDPKLFEPARKKGWTKIVGRVERAIAS